ncbi:MAG: CBS domain-containing protein [Magnetococcales bacterium]|nr:CBS domain-containing protein [Magnetococcales bacterium]
METPDKLVSKTRPFFLNFFNRLANDMNALTASPVSVTLGDVTLMRGHDELEQVFEMDRSFAMVTEDGLNCGYGFIVFDVTTSIAMTGLMMMMGEGLIEEQVKNREYNDEIQEGFQEVVNQVVGAWNDLVEAKLEGSHLYLELDKTRHVDFAEIPDEIPEDTTFLCVRSEIQVSKQEPVDSYWVLNRSFAEKLLKVEFPGPEDADAGPGGGGGAEEDEGTVDLDGELDGGAEGDEEGSLSESSGGVGLQPELGEGGQILTEEEKAKLMPGGLDDALDGLVDEDGNPVSLDGDDDSDDKLSGEVPKHLYQKGDGLPLPDEPGSIAALISEQPFSLKEGEKVINAINAMRQDGFRFIGVDNQGGKLIRVLTQTDLRQLMGPFYGTKAMTTRDKAVLVLPLSKINEQQQLVHITLTGTINQAANLVQEFNLRALPVVSKQGVLRGFVTAHDLLNYFRRKKQG